MQTERCEWPRRKGAVEKCGNVAGYVATSPGRTPAEVWSRNVCGIHANRARYLNWSVTDSPEPPLAPVTPGP